MELTTFLVVAAITLIFVIFFEIIRLLAAYRKCKLEEARAELSEQVLSLNKNALLNGSIKKGDFTHDNLYPVFFGFLLINPYFELETKTIKYTPQIKRDFKRFQENIEELDSETKMVVMSSIYAIGKIVFFKIPFKFAFSCLKKKWLKKDFHITFKKPELKKEFIENAQYYTLQSCGFSGVSRAKQPSAA